MFPARRRRPPAAPRSRAEVSPRRRSLKGSRTPRRPRAGGRSGAGASAAASPARRAEAGHALPRALSFFSPSSSPRAARLCPSAPRQAGGRRPARWLSPDHTPPGTVLLHQ